MSMNMSENKKIIIVRAGPLSRDTRVTKIISSLEKHGYMATLLSWDQTSVSKRSERYEAGSNLRSLEFKLNVKMGIQTILALPIWWFFVFFRLMIEKWDLVHAVQITTIFPSLLAGIFKRKPVIYELLDIYEDSISIPRLMRNIFVYIDKIFMYFSTAVVLADEEEAVEVGGIPNSLIVPIYDSPHTLYKIDLAHKKNDKFTLFFAGNLSKKKFLNIDKIVESLKDLNDVNVIIAGFGDLADDLNKWAEEMPDKLQFIGEISHAEVLERSAKADALFVLRSPSLLVNRYICGSKVLEAMMCGRPLIVNNGTSTAKIVKEANCGIIVDATNVSEIKNAILKLKDNEKYCNFLGINGKNAFDMRFSWSIMEYRLLNLYEQILNNEK